MRRSIPDGSTRSTAADGAAGIENSSPSCGSACPRSKLDGAAIEKIDDKVAEVNARPGRTALDGPIGIARGR